MRRGPPLAKTRTGLRWCRRLERPSGTVATSDPIWGLSKDTDARRATPAGRRRRRQTGRLCHRRRRHRRDGPAVTNISALAALVTWHVLAASDGPVSISAAGAERHQAHPRPLFFLLHRLAVAVPADGQAGGGQRGLCVKQEGEWSTRGWGLAGVDSSIRPLKPNPKP